MANHGELFNLITTIQNPSLCQTKWLSDFSPDSVLAGADDVNDVVATIFPMRLHSRSVDRIDFYNGYKRIHNRAMKWRRNRSRWGTYFERLISYNGTVNQLEVAISKLINWPVRNTTGLVFHLSCPLLDAPRTRGGPCWHFGEIIWNADGTLDLVAVYRNHDFFNKALGNFIALGQLLNFISVESGKTPGKLICHSIHAYSEAPQRTLSVLAQI